MEIPIVDPRVLPAEFRKMALTSSSLIAAATQLYNSVGTQETPVPVPIRIGYTNIFNAHISIINTGISNKEDLNFKAFKTRFDAFAVKDKKGILDSLGLVIELSQIVLTLIGMSRQIVSKVDRFRYVDHKRYEKAISSKAQLANSILNAYKLAISYAKYKDESLMEEVEPYLQLYLKISPHKRSGIKMPYLRDSEIKALAIKARVMNLLNSCKVYYGRYLMYSKYLDPEDNSYKDAFHSQYRALAINYLTYPSLFTEEMKTTTSI